MEAECELTPRPVLYNHSLYTDTSSQKKTTKTSNIRKASKHGHIYEHNARKPRKRSGIRPPSPCSPQSPPCGARQSREEPWGQAPGKDRCVSLPSCIAFFVCSFQIGVLPYLICAACRSRVWADLETLAVVNWGNFIHEMLLFHASLHRGTRSISYNFAPRDKLS